MDNKLIQEFQGNLTNIAEVEQKISKAIAVFNDQLKSLQERDQDMREQIKTAMRENDVKVFENDLIKISYKAPSQRVTIDTKKLKAELPELWEQYSQTTDVKDSISIKVKEQK